MKNIYVFGNEYLEDDAFAKRVAKVINNTFNVVLCTTPEVLLDVEEKEILILDVVKDIKEPIVIKDISQLKTRNIVSLHDFDLTYFLKLMQGIGMNKKMKIIGIPQRGDIKRIAQKVREYIT
jgi:Ni,Fe-hydrogenase maturation factor